MNKQIKPKQHKCDGCGKIKPCKYVVDPFQAEIHDQEVWLWLCDECYQNSLDDI